MERIDYSIEKVNECIQLFDAQEGLKEGVLKKAFSGLSNTDCEAVLVSVTLLNTFYSTRLNNTAPKRKADNETIEKTHIDVESMAKHIASNHDLDKWIYSQDEEERLKAFDYIATGISEYKKEHHYAASSFASKYCSWCNPDCFPIMDSYSRGMLYRINAELPSPFYPGRLSQDGLRDYQIFCKAHRHFQELLELKHKTSYSTKEIDKYLWYYGTNHPGIAIE